MNALAKRLFPNNKWAQSPSLNLAEACSAQFVNGHWRKARISGRHASKLRREALRDGLELPASLQRAPADADFSLQSVRAPKGHKFEREETLRKRQEMMKQKQAQIPKILKEAKKQREKLGEKPLKGLELLYVQPNRRQFRMWRTQSKNVKQTVYDEFAASNS